MEGLAIASMGEVHHSSEDLLSRQATTSTEANVTKLRIASQVPLVLGFMEGHLHGDLIVKHVKEVKEMLSHAYGSENLDKVRNVL